MSTIRHLPEYYIPTMYEKNFIDGNNIVKADGGA
jgi:hypothetical protein